jgi:CDGSH-type Zn-finger protein
MGFEFGCKCGRTSHEKGYCDGTHKQPKVEVKPKSNTDEQEE